MFVPRVQTTLTPTQFTTFMHHKPPSQQVVMLALQTGNVLVIADENLPPTLVARCAEIPLTVAPHDYTVEQFTAFLDTSTEFYRWAYYLDEEDFTKRALESLLQQLEPNIPLPVAVCLSRIQQERLLTRQVA